MIYKWHSWLGMPRFDKAWHEKDMMEELAEYHEEQKLVKRWSEVSDVAYTYTRARWSGHELEFPLAQWQLYVGYLYMLPKYTGRFLFYKQAAKKAGAKSVLRCVRNPKKLHKLDAIISEENVDVDLTKLKAQCQKQLKYWVLLP